MVTYLEEIFEAIDEGGHDLSEWEKSFMEDQRKRYETYKADTRFSPKQMAVVDKIAKALGVEKPVQEIH
jgi:hypothetical protein